VLLIDPLGGTSPALIQTMGTPREPLIPLTGISASAILVTHIHPDHFDPSSIRMSYGDEIPIYVPLESAPYVGKSGLKNVHGMSVGDTIVQGTVTITATFSVDGFGFPQVAWIVEGKGKKLIHCGDTMRHGYWWKIAGSYGPFDIACLPINGAVLEVPGLSVQSALPACLTPEEAVHAAAILKAGKLVPIHYHTFHQPPVYIETPDALDRLLASAGDYAIDVRILQPGDVLTSEPSSAS